VKRSLRITALVLVAGLVFAVGFVHLPYYAVGPGPAQQVEPLIDVQGHQRYPSSGKLIMTTVRWYQVTALQALVAWLDPHQAVVSRASLYGPGQDAAAEQRRALSQMDQSKIDAAYVALSHVVGYPAAHGDGALIETTGSGCPADGKLYSGDTILAIDGHPVGNARAASRLLDRAKRGVPTTFRVEAAGQTHDIRVSKGRCPGADRPLFGISIVDAFPFSVSIASGDIGGPSAGLMFALGLYDTLTPGDLTQGRTIAGTGTIDPKGDVGPIGGISDKVVAAQRVGATVFLVPRGNMGELKGIDTGTMKLMPVGTFQEALTALSAPV
jgi:PDZ domain-containing protein